MNQRQEFVLKALQPQVNFSDLCRQYGITRNTGYKWVKRFNERGLRGLEELTRGPAPGRRPLKCTGDMAIEILLHRRSHPTWGPKKLRAVLLRVYNPDEVPSARTISRVIERAGLASHRRAKRRKWLRDGKRPDVPVNAPNDLWTVDFKGWWRLRDGKKCEPLTIRDAHSRFILAIKLVRAPSTDQVRPVFERLFEDHGMPLAILSDNGTPFAASQGPMGLTTLSAWWISLGIRVVRSRIGSPQDNGAHERMHLDMARELERFPALNVRQQQDQCDVWRHEFNHHRPHGALDMGTPVGAYRNSPRVFPDGPPGLTYPDHMVTRKVSSCGTMRYAGYQRHLSKALRSQFVGVEPLPNARFKVWFSNVPIGIGTLPWNTGLLPSDQDEHPPKTAPSKSSADTSNRALSVPEIT